MAVTILETPKAVSFASNAMRFKVQADSYIFQAGVKAEFTIGLVGFGGQENLKETDTYTMQFLGRTYTFEFTTEMTPTAGKLPIEDGEGAFGSYETYAACLKAFLEKNYFLTRNYTIEIVNNHRVKLVARQEGSAYNITGDYYTDEEIYYFYQVASVAGVDLQYERNRYVRADIYIEHEYNSGKFEYYANIQQLLTDSDIVWFDISDRMEPYFRDQIETDVFNNAQTFLTKINKRYKISFTEFYGGQYDYVTDHTESEILRAHKGGIKKDEFAIYPDLVNQYLKEKKEVLSWRPTNKMVTKKQPECLYFLNYKEELNPTELVVRIHFTGNSSPMYKNVWGRDAHYKHETVAFRVDYQQIRAYADEVIANQSKEIAYYSLTVVQRGTGAILSKEMIYTVVDAHVLDRFFVYENSFGVFETLHTVSSHKYNVDVDMNEGLVSLPAGSTYNAGEIKSINKGYEERFSGSTGAITEEEAVCLTDFRISRHRFLKKGNRLINIVVSGGKFSPYEDDGYPFGFSFNYKKAYRQTQFSNLLGVSFDDKIIIEEDNNDSELTPG